VKGYGTDLALIHHLGFGDLARRSAQFVLATLRRAGVRSGLVVDLGCGSGILARELTKASYEVLGLDGSPTMIALARRVAPAATFRVASFVSAPLPPCDAVTAAGEVLGYLLDPRNDATALRHLFARVRAALRPGGLFLFDLPGPGRVPGGSRRGFSEGAGWAVLHEVRERGFGLERRIVTFRRVGGSWRRREEVHRLRLHRPGAVLADLRAAGFRARALSGYGAVRLGPGWTVFLARAPVTGRHPRARSASPSHAPPRISPGRVAVARGSGAPGFRGSGAPVACAARASGATSIDSKTG
jgi:SAM-dependent methyltransferase